VLPSCYTPLRSRVGVIHSKAEPADLHSDARRSNGRRGPTSRIRCGPGILSRFTRGHRPHRSTSVRRGPPDQHQNANRDIAVPDVESSALFDVGSWRAYAAAGARTAGQGTLFRCSCAIVSRRDQRGGGVRITILMLSAQTNAVEALRITSKRRLLPSSPLRLSCLFLTEEMWGSADGHCRICSLKKGISRGGRRLDSITSMSDTV
jgi:hypothetical protein